MQSFIVNENGEHKGGQIICSVCGSRAGVRWTKYRGSNDPDKWTDRITCRCGSTKRFLAQTGEIIEQRLTNQPIGV